MSLTSYRAAPPRDSRSEHLPIESGKGGEGVWRAWRRPTLPPLERQYHWRRGFSRPSSGWDRVFGPSLWPPGRPSPPFGLFGWVVRMGWGESCEVKGEKGLGGCRVRVLALHAGGCAAVLRTAGDQADRAISTGQLRGLLPFHLRPIDVVVFHGSHRDLVLRRVSRLDAFSGYPVRT